MSSANRCDPDEPVIPSHTPYLSHSRLSRYLHCPEQYRLYYVENLRPRLPAASLIFGQAIHQALAGLFQAGNDPVKRFQEIWRNVGELEVEYSQKEPWGKLRTTGEILLAKFVAEELPQIGRPAAVEKFFELKVSNIDLPFVGIIDLVADFNGERTVIDFKTAGQAFEDHEVILSDQLSAYQLAEPSAQQVALCVLVKSKVPKIEWHLTNRTPGQLTEYLTKAGLIAHAITAGHFYKRPGKWCAWCDFLPVCVGDTNRAKEALIQIDPTHAHESGLARQEATHVSQA